jgi:hypothetical protein
MMLLLMSVCTLPNCAFGLLVIAVDVGALEKMGNLDLLTATRNLYLIFGPLFGVFLFFALESGFNLHTVYFLWFGRKFRACKYKIFGPPKGKKGKRVDDDDELGDKLCGCFMYLYNLIIQTGELCCFSVWGLVMWLPMEVFKQDVKSEKKQLAISIVYLIMLLLPTACFLNWVPVIFEDMGNSDDKVYLKAAIGNVVLVTYIVCMFSGVGGALYISRKKPSLNYVADPKSHVRKSFTNLNLLVNMGIEGVQLSSLLLTHPSFTEITAPKLDDSLLDDGDKPWMVNLNFLKVFVFDLSSFEIYRKYQEDAFRFKLYLSMLGVVVWVLLVTIPAVIDNIRLQRSGLFVKIWAKFGIVQGILSGPGFFVILDSLLSTMDCAQHSEDADIDVLEGNSTQIIGRYYMEAYPSQECWATEHFLFATLGLTGLTAFVPLAALTMTEDYDEGIDIRFTPLFFRCEVLAKGLMSFTMRYTDGYSPFVGFPVMAGLAISMAMMTNTMKPCCVFWINHLKTAAFLAQLWTAVGGIIVFNFYEDFMERWGAVPVPPTLFLSSGWVAIGVWTLSKINADISMLKKQNKKRKAVVESWAEALHDDAVTRTNASRQLAALDTLTLDEGKESFGTHHQVLKLMWIIQSDTTAAMKQRALQVFSYSCSAANGGHSEKEGKEHPHKQMMSVDTRRRLLGFQGDEDLDQDEIHTPMLVLLTPLKLIDLLGDEFHMSEKRDLASRVKHDDMWKITGEACE